MLTIADWKDFSDEEDLEDAKAGNCFYLVEPTTKAIAYKVYLNNNKREALCVPTLDTNEVYRGFCASVCLAFGYTPREVSADG